MTHNRGAFTLMEILLVAVLMSVVAIATTRVFANGLKLWVAGERVVVESDLMVFFDRFGEDLRGVQPLTGIAFKGLDTQISFPAMVLTVADHNSARAREEMVDQIGAVQYRFDPASGKVFRRQANYSQALKQQWGAEAEVVRGIEEVQWTYDFPSDKGLVTKSGADDEVPSGVSLTVRLSGEQSFERSFKRHFPIPVGGGL